MVSSFVMRVDGSVTHTDLLCSLPVVAELTLATIPTLPVRLAIIIDDSQYNDHNETSDLTAYEEGPKGGANESTSRRLVSPQLLDLHMLTDDDSGDLVQGIEVGVCREEGFLVWGLVRMGFVSWW